MMFVILTGLDGLFWTAVYRVEIYST